MPLKFYSVMADMQGLAVNGVKPICNTLDKRVSTDLRF